MGPRSSENGACRDKTQTSRRGHISTAVGSPGDCGEADAETTAFSASYHCLRFLKPSTNVRPENAVR